MNVVVPPPVPKAEAGSDWPLVAIWGATWDRDIVPKTKPLTANEAKTAITTVSTVAKIVAVALRCPCLRADLPLIQGDAELGGAWVEVGPRTRLFANVILTYEVHGTGAEPMISLPVTSFSRYMPIMDSQSVATIPFFLQPPS